MARTSGENRHVVKNVQRSVKQLRDLANTIVTTAPDIPDLHKLLKIINGFAAIEKTRDDYLDLFARAQTVNEKLAEIRHIALTAVQTLLPRIPVLEIFTTSIKGCTVLLRILIEPRCNDGLQELSQDLMTIVDQAKAIVVSKADASLQSIVARASANEPRTPWPALLRDFGDFEDLFSINPALFVDAQGIQTLLHRIMSAFCPPPAQASTRPAVQPVHVNQVVWDLCNNPKAPYLATTASSAFGGVCSNNFLPATNERIWVNSPLPKTPYKRAIAMSWITMHLHEQASLLLAQCQIDLRPQESADGMSKSIMVHSMSNDQYFQEKHSVIHLVHLPRLKTYHLTEYREHVVHLPFETVVQWRKNRLYAKVAKCPPWEKVGNMALSYMGPSYGVKTKGLTNNYILTREFDGDAEYCEIATSITADDGKGCPNLVGLKREWTNWVIVAKLDESTTSVVQMSVATGLQLSSGEFVPYDNVVREEDCAGPSAAFEGLARRLKQDCAEAFEKDAKRCIKGLQEVMANPPEASSVSTSAYQLSADGAFLDESNSTSETAMNSALDALTNPAIAGHHTMTSSGAHAAPIFSQNSRLQTEDNAKVDDAPTRLQVQREIELRQALAILIARHTSREYDPVWLRARDNHSQLALYLTSNPRDVLTLVHLEKNEANLRRWVQRLLDLSDSQAED